MPAKSTSIVINALGGTDGKTKVKNTISYVNPAISDSVALELGQRVSALTTDSYQTTNRVDTIELDTASNPHPITELWMFTNAGGAAKTTISLDTKTLALRTNQFLVSSAPEGFLYRIPFFVTTPYDGSAPVVTGSSTDSQTEFIYYGNAYNFDYSTDARQRNAWSIEFRFSQLVAQTITLHVKLPRSDTYSETEFDLTFNITAE